MSYLLCRLYIFCFTSLTGVPMSSSEVLLDTYICIMWFWLFALTSSWLPKKCSFKHLDLPVKKKLFWTTEESKQTAWNPSFFNGTMNNWRKGKNKQKKRLINKNSIKNCSYLKWKSKQKPRYWQTKRFHLSRIQWSNRGSFTSKL